MCGQILWGMYRNLWVFQCGTEFMGYSIDLIRSVARVTNGKFEIASDLLRVIDNSPGTLAHKRFLYETKQ